MLEAGQNQFNQPFDPEHGWGEGANGPRSKQRAVWNSRVLWGIGDTAPYMHDGRARTLPEAIMLHGADGSEAQPIYQKVAALPAGDQLAIIAFLESQRLPISQGITDTEYVSQ